MSVFTSNPASVDVVTLSGGVSGPVLSRTARCLSAACRCCEGGRLELGARTWRVRGSSCAAPSAS